MISNHLARLAAGLAALALITAIAAAVVPRGTVPAAVAADATFTITGLVSGVAYAQNVIEVTTATGKESIHVTPTTSIAKHGQAGSISDIRPGVHVVVTGVVTGGQHIAVTIEIK